VCEALATHMICGPPGSMAPTAKTSLRRYCGSRVSARDCASSPTSAARRQQPALEAHFTFTGGGAISWHGFAEVCSRIAEILWDHMASVAPNPLRRSSSLGGRKLWRGSNRNGARCHISVADRAGARRGPEQRRGTAFPDGGARQQGLGLTHERNRRLRHCCCRLEK